MPVLQERLDKTTLRELLRLAELKEKRAAQAGLKNESEHWYRTAEWFRDLLAA